MSTSKLAGIALLLAVAFSLFDGAYLVNETEQVIITQFGKPLGQPVVDPGLRFKVPFIQRVNRFEKRFLEWDGSPNQVPTRDKRFIWVDTMARWQIKDPLLFFQRLRDERGAQSRLDDILDGETRNTIAKHVLIEVVRTSNKTPVVETDERAEEEKGAEAEAVAEEAETNEPDQDAPEEISDDVIRTAIEDGRDVLAAEVLASAKEALDDLGIEVLDFRFKRINYQEAVRAEVYTRMISERARIAEQYRSEGQGEAARINGERARQLKVITSEAYREAKEITGRADAAAADIYAEAYNRNREFYSFLKTMELYPIALGDDSRLVLGTEGHFLRYLGQSR
jgi:membrane protease subunit HflC